MPGSELLLDTNALIALTRNDGRVLAAVAGLGMVSLSLFTLGEMQYGAAKSARCEDNRRRLQVVLESFRLILPESETARVYGDIFHQLRLKGRPIPTNDVWIAAVAIQYGIPLLTRDAHFEEVPALDVRSW